MNLTIILAYLLIIIGILPFSVLLPTGKKISEKVVSYITVFGGAFLFASTFINMVPHIFIGEEPYRFVTPNLHIKIAAAVMIGFLIQLLLEQLTRGIEHGHNHCHTCETHSHKHQMHPITGLLIGLSIHAFLEGMPMIGHDGDIHQGLLYGIVLHNIPITLILLSLFATNHYGFWKSLGLLAIFAVMTPLGSLCNLYFLPANDTLQAILMGIVVGILLHVSVSILFDHQYNRFSRLKLLLILLAFVCAYLVPGCPEIYG